MISLIRIIPNVSKTFIKNNFSSITFKDFIEIQQFKDWIDKFQLFNFKGPDF